MALAINRCASFSLLWFLFGYAVAAHADIDPLFASNDPLEVTITAPIWSIMRNRSSDDYVPGTLTYAEPGSEPIHFDVGLRARGNFRRQADLCGFAPLRVNFKKSQTKNTVFAHQDKLKLVSHCQLNDSYEQSVISEYLVYRTFNVLTDISFRVRRLRIVYEDTERNNRVTESIGFFIEHKKRLAQRAQMTAAEDRKVSISWMQPELTNLTSLFQYFIGNTDFSHTAPEPAGACCHNQSLFVDARGTYFSIPYDFDMSGFVNAPHSAPSTASRLRNVRQRRYQGSCVNNEHLPKSVETLIAKREIIYDVIRAEEQLENYKRKSLLKFLDKFYESVDSPRKIEKNLINDCVE